MGHAVNDVIEMSQRGLFNGQVILNVWHVFVESGVSGASDIADNYSLAQYYASLVAPTEPIGRYLTLLPADYILQRIRAQKIYPTRSTYAEQDVSLVGTAVGVADHSATCAVFTKQGLTGTRRAIGSMHIGPMPALAAHNGILDGGYETQLNNYASTWRTSFVVPANSTRYRPCIYNPGVVPPFQSINNTIVQTTARTMRRRVVGRGI
jgi:hypothetical protein